MLVLTIKTGQRVEIGETITVDILGVTGSAVKVGIVAPGYPILRPNVRRRLERLRALGVAPDNPHLR